MAQRILAIMKALEKDFPDWEYHITVPEQLAQYEAIVIGREFLPVDQIQMTKQLRMDTAIPVLILTQKHNGNHAANCLRHGADDVIAYPPASPAEVIARVGAKIRITGRALCPPVLQFEHHRFLLTENRLVSGDISLDLLGIEAVVLRQLIMAGGRLQTKDSLHEELKKAGGTETAPKIVHVAVCRLRKKLLASGINLNVTSVWGHGYKLQHEKEVRDVATATSGRNRSEQGHAGLYTKLRA